MAPSTSTSYRGPQVCKIVGITYRQLDYWARTDLVRPSVQDAAGSGTQREYSYRDLVELKVIKNLLDAGVSLQAARKAIEYLRGHLGEELASAHLVLQGSDSLLAYTGDEIVDLLRQGQGVLNIVALGPVVQDLDASIVALDGDATTVARDRTTRIAAAQ
jgi:DNA-binding transcriptional MerR regulator